MVAKSYSGLTGLDTYYGKRKMTSSSQNCDSIAVSAVTVCFFAFWGVWANKERINTVFYAHFRPFRQLLWVDTTALTGWSCFVFGIKIPSPRLEL